LRFISSCSFFLQSFNSVINFLLLGLFILKLFF
jgi:hypothetical protein